MNDEVFINSSSVMTSNAQKAGSNRETIEQLAGFMAVNQIYLDFVDKLIAKVDRAIDRNREYQNAIKEQLSSRKRFDEVPRNLVTTLVCYPPYFKDSAGMAPRLNDDTKNIQKIRKADPLMCEERLWRQNDLKLLKNGVKESLIENLVMPLFSRKDLLVEKNMMAGVDVPVSEKQVWRDEIERINRRIVFLRERSDTECFTGVNFDAVDWMKISATDFNGSRSVLQLKMRWCNEEAPMFNKEEWTDDEDKRLKELSKRPWLNWDVIAEQMGTSRSAYNCFQRFKHLQIRDRGRKLWTADEDEKLEFLVQTLRVGEEIPWCKISTYLSGRTKEMCQSRYVRSLNSNLKHGRWTITEDLILLNGINKYGPQDWPRIADLVQNRSSIQCRDRWVNVLDYKRRNRPWLWEEHERLFFGIRIFGKKNYAKIALLLPGRNNMDVKQRIFSLMRFKIAKFEEEVNGSRKAEYKNISSSYMFKKDRRDMVLSKFRQFMEVISRVDNNKMQQLDNRMGMGSFMLTPSGNPVDYSVSKKTLQFEFGRLLTRGGRWTGISRNPNEFGTKELEDELRKLLPKKKKELQKFLMDSNIRYAEESNLEERLADFPEQLVLFYEKLMTAERKAKILALMEELLPVEVSDVTRYNKMKARAPKLNASIKTALNLASSSTEKRQGLKKRKITTFSFEDIAPKRFVTAKDRLLQEVKEQICSVGLGDQRRCVIRNLCTYIRRSDDFANIARYKREGLKRKSITLTINYLSEILEINLNKTLIENSNDVAYFNNANCTPNFFLKDALSRLVAPCVGTLNATVLYQTKMRLDLLKCAGRLFDCVNPEDFSHLPPQSVDDFLDIRLTDSIKKSREYIELKKRIYRMFFLPFIMHLAISKPEDLHHRCVSRESVYRRRLAEQNFVEEIQKNIGCVDLNSLALNENCSIFKIYNNKEILSVENDYMTEIQKKTFDKRPQF